MFHSCAERLLTGWVFAEGNLDGTASMDSLDFQPVTLPHDFLICHHEDLYKNTLGVYKRSLTLTEEDADRRLFLHFEGVYMDADVLLDGELLCTHHYGYTPFRVNLTGKAQPGVHEITVLVHYRAPNSRWYSGAGIYRDVYLERLPGNCILPDSLAYRTERLPDGAWRLTASVETLGDASSVPTVRLGDGDKSKMQAEDVQNGEPNRFSVSMTLQDVKPWSLSCPSLIPLTVSLPGQTLQWKIGFRETAFDPDHGFFLNGEHVKLKGVCLHHDLGALGSAFHEKAFRRQLRVMREMGCNALRTSHNPWPKKALEICDEMGFLVVSEAFDMWESPKTQYDYARFFWDDAASDVAAWVREGRCHPSVIMWSIGNEIHDTHMGRGEMITKFLSEEVRKNDPFCHARVTIGSNYMPWEGAQKCADILKVAGYNYAEKYYAPHHAAHPDWVIYGSETASVLSSRGIYHFPQSAHILSDEDLQCSSLGNSPTSWGAQSMSHCLVDDLKCEYSMGQFLWSGIDYIGEPTPYHTRNCYFGMTDTCCFPKDLYYQVKAAWTDESMVHIGVSWDWNEGQLIDVPVMSNAPCVRLTLNGEEVGRQTLSRLDPDRSVVLFRIPYHPGTLTAQAMDEEGNVLATDQQVTPGAPACLRMKSDDAFLLGDGQDITFVTVDALDEHGQLVLNACNPVSFSVKGPAVILGVDNGDSTDTDPYVNDAKHLFSGKCLVILGSTGEEGTVVLTASCPGLPPATLTLPVRTADTVTPGRREPVSLPIDLREPVRKIELTAPSPICLTPECPEALVNIRLEPENAMSQDLSVRVINDRGIDSPSCEAILQGDTVILRGRGDGELMLRVSASNDASHPRVLSHLNFTLEGFGKPDLDPYESISAGLYTRTIGEITSGNEQGISFARDGVSGVIFDHVDFGKAGSDTLTMPIFALDSDLHVFQLYLGVPGEGGEKIADLPYQKKSIWNVYQEETWHLGRVLTGLQTLTFLAEKKVHMKSLHFEKQSRAFHLLPANSCDLITGDTFERRDDGIYGIGNNVSLVFEEMDFGEGGEVQLLADAMTPLSQCQMTVHVEGNHGETTFPCLLQGGDRRVQTFTGRVPAGICRVTLIFLPGSQLDLHSIRFVRPEES